MYLGAGLCSLLCITLCAPSGEQVHTRAREQAAAPRQAGKPLDAVGALETALRAEPDSPGALATIVVLEQILSRDVTDPTLRERVCQTAFDEFSDVPLYYCLVAAHLAKTRMYNRPTDQRDPAGAAELMRQVLDTLDDKLPLNHYLGWDVIQVRINGLARSGQSEEALACAREWLARAPGMLGTKGFLKGAWEAASRGKDLTRAKEAAKLYYLLCDYTEADVLDATECARRSLAAADGPGAALAWGRAQDDAAAPNPLREVAVLDLGPADELLPVVEKDPRSRLMVLLYAGRLSEAIDVGKEQMRKAGTNEGKMATALRDLARCFKARDLNLVRANRFLEFHRTGQGANPLPELEDELAAEARENG